MESLNALLQGMGLMHLGIGQAIMLLVSLLLLWLAIAKKFEPLLLRTNSTRCWRKSPACARTSALSRW